MTGVQTCALPICKIIFPQKNPVFIGKENNLAFGRKSARGVTHNVFPFPTALQPVTPSPSIWQAWCVPDFCRDQHGGFIYTHGQPLLFQGIFSLFFIIRVRPHSDALSVCPDVLVAPHAFHGSYVIDFQSNT